MCILLISSHIAGANETFQNNLLKMDFAKSSISGIKVTLYTSKPYKDNVIVNKKNNSEYVILMPETSNSMTSNPVLNSVANSVRGVNVKTQQYENQVKGYTKITITTSKPVEITPSVQTISSSIYGLSEKDYNELLAQTGKKKISKTETSYKKPVLRPQTVVEKKKTKLAAEEKKAVTKPLPVKSQMAAQKLIPAKKIAQQQQQTVIKQKTTQPAKKVEKSSPVAQKAEVKPKAQEPQTVKENVEPEVQTKLQKQPIQEEKVTQPEQLNKPVTSVAEKVTPPITNIDRFQKYKQIVKNNLYSIAGLLFAGFLLLLLIARNMNKNNLKQKEVFKTNLEETPIQATDYTEKINEDMTWKEKFQTYVDTVQNQPSEAEKPIVEPTQDNKELDELFSDSVPPQVDTTQDEPFAQEEAFMQGEPETFNAEMGLGQVQEESEQEDMSVYSMNQEGYSDTAQIDELFAEEELTESNLPGEVEVGQEEEIIKSEFSIDNQKGFYLVDFRNTSALVGHIEDEIFVLKKFDNRVDGTLQARLSERTEKSSNYMTKVGKFKALVEVTPNNMSLLIEL